MAIAVSPLTWSDTVSFDHASQPEKAEAEEAEKPYASLDR